MSDQNSLLTVKQVATMLSVGNRTILRWIHAGHFPNAYKMGPSLNSGYRIPQSDVDAFLKEIKERQVTNSSEES